MKRLLFIALLVVEWWIWFNALLVIDYTYNMGIILEI